VAPIGLLQHVAGVYQATVLIILYHQGSTAAFEGKLARDRSAPRVTCLDDAPPILQAAVHAGQKELMFISGQNGPRARVFIMIDSREFRRIAIAVR
jgi:hypothetical protein